MEEENKNDLGTEKVEDVTGFEPEWGDFAAKEAEVSEPEIAEAEISEPVISEPIISEADIAEPVIAATTITSVLTDDSDTASQEPIKAKWNWGAFAFPLFFGVGHRAYLGLLILLGMIPWIGPIFALVWSIVFGFHGEKWALENRDNHYRDEEEFRKIMDSWNRAGLIGFIVMIAGVLLFILLVIIMLTFVVNSPDFQNGFSQSFN